MYGKTALVTGASRGIGAAIARRLLFEGANVVLFARDEANLHEVAGAPYEQCGRALVVAGDLTNADDRQRLLDDTLVHYQHIDLLVACAGIVQFLPLEQTTEQTLLHQFDLNFFAPAQLTREVVKYMPKGGTLIFITSSITDQGFAGLSTYAASKGALRSFAKTLAVELAPRGIAFYSIAPGPTETQMWSEALPPETLVQVKKQLRPRLLTGDFGKVDAIAEVVVMLAQVETIRGEEIRIDCGYAIS